MGTVIYRTAPMPVCVSVRFCFWAGEVVFFSWLVYRPVLLYDGKGFVVSVTTEERVSALVELARLVSDGEIPDAGRKKRGPRRPQRKANLRLAKREVAWGVIPAAKRRGFRCPGSTQRGRCR